MNVSMRMCSDVFKKKARFQLHSNNVSLKQLLLKSFINKTLLDFYVLLFIS